MTRYYYDRIPLSVDFATFVGWFDWMEVQRHLKAIGIFACLNYRDGKPGYLSDIPRVMAYIKPMCEKYPELTPLADFLIVDVKTLWQ